MAGLTLLKQVKDAVSNLNPNEVRAMADRPFTIGLTASSNAAYERMEQFLVPPNDPADRDKPLQLGRIVYRKGAPGAPTSFDIELAEEGILKPRHAISFNLDQPDNMIKKVLDAHPDLSLPLARNIAAFRQPVIQRAIKNVAKENALFALATAVPNIIPLLSLPLSVGEAASDTAFITMNQIRLAFLVAAAYNAPIGYGEQRGQIGSVIASAFGWRAIARELVGYIPMGGGLIPKAGLAYAGTYVVGASIERYYRIGKQYTDEEKKAVFQQALAKGKEIASAVMESLKSQQRVKAS